tara:strand:- start:4011 stop:4280 length:270 start_codon:yes stop_codon:yes gene_type:complete
MSLTLNFLIPNIRNTKTHAFIDPAQYDTEINSARGFKFPTPSKTKVISKSKKINHTIRVENGVTYDPDQFDVEENYERHLLHKHVKSNW